MTKKPITGLENGSDWSLLQKIYEYGKEIKRENIKLEERQKLEFSKLNLMATHEIEWRWILILHHN